MSRSGYSGIFGDAAADEVFDNDSQEAEFVPVNKLDERDASLTIRREVNEPMHVILSADINSEENTAFFHVEHATNYKTHFSFYLDGVTDPFVIIDALSIRLRNGDFFALKSFIDKFGKIHKDAVEFILKLDSLFPSTISLGQIPGGF